MPYQSSRRSFAALRMRGALREVEVIAIVAVARGGVLFRRHGDRGDGDADLQQHLHRLREAEADQKADDRAAGGELRGVVGGDGLEVEGGAQAAVELVDTVADVVAGAADLFFDGLFLVAHDARFLARAMSSLMVSTSRLMFSIDALGTNCSAANFFFPITARIAAPAKS